MTITPSELRECAELQSYEEWHFTRPKLLEAAAEIERLTAENERLRAAIRWACGEEEDASGKWFGDAEFSAPTAAGRPRPFGWRTNLRKISGVDLSS